MKVVEKVLPSFKEFMQNPVGLVALFALLAVGYLYIDNKVIVTAQVEICREENRETKKEVDKLKQDYQELLDKYIELIEKLK
tara:strand:+ start:452 stop:697 length:246 start_codon:yes stop_codon:yes gene_type:complete